ncbi:transcriptional regulator TrmB [Micromonospora sp. S4605]|uniref:helix-turn-helix transcriptional regulator n=1 Tax=Micromonospora sp. S4605 TaxID=1420897 RepID=UPI000D6F2953|nr:helix-turn-helix domain-containing protein [Micromonospora sp. S4605]PWU56116.1 transcriptional regulator TrmB [Micromonospora sp. S4605]
MVEVDLRALGLSADECAMYLLLVDRPAATADDVGEDWRSTSGDSPAAVLTSLEAKGLVTTLAGHPVRHAAVAPDVALDNLSRVREQEIAKARALAGELTERWRRAGRATVPAGIIEVVVGRQATLQRFEQIQRTSTTEVLIIDTPPYAAEHLGNPLETQLLTEGVTSYRCLYDRSALETPGKYEAIRGLVAAGEVARVIPGLPLKMVIGDRRIAMLPLETAPEAITAAAVIHPSSLLDSLHLLFETLWQQATPLVAGPTPGSLRTGPRLDPLEQNVVRLLVAGLTDKAIGRQLNLAERTTQRRVQAIMQAYGVHNRLQLGIRLAQEGWA